MDNNNFTPNPTDAKTLALHFLDLTTKRMTPQIIARTIIQVKAVLAQGYTVEEVTKVIDYVLARKAGVYSFGYISSAINDSLRELEAEEARIRYQAEAKVAHAELASTMQESRGRVTEVDDSTERNKRKAKRSNIQSRFGKKSYFDMFEGK